jgi:anthranilate phosphoribosyltransferase
MARVRVSLAERSNVIIEAIQALVEGQSLTVDQAAAAMSDIMEDRATPAQFGAFVTALRMKGETPDEVAGMARTMREKVRRVPTDLPVVDTCGTGGDGSGSFNVSTAAAFIVAGAGVPVAKHGNRGMTSKSGSADVLEALGVAIMLEPDGVSRCIDEACIGFMFAPSFHPAMRFAAPLRREVAIRTIFNVLGPLTNPAGALRQVVGVPSDRFLPIVAGAFARLGAVRSLVVHGAGGLDEISVSGPTSVHDVGAGISKTYQVHPEDAGFLRHPAHVIAGGTADENARMMRALFAGTDAGPEADARRDIACLNAAAALVAAGVAKDLADGGARARESLRSGAAQSCLEALIRTSHAAVP